MPAWACGSRSAPSRGSWVSATSNPKTSARFELGIPVEEVAPALMQEVRRERPAVLLKQAGARLAGQVARIHAALARQPVALEQIAARAGGNHVFPDRAAAARTRHDVIEGQVVRREILAAILAGEAVAQKDVESREGRSPRRRN